MTRPAPEPQAWMKHPDGIYHCHMPTLPDDAPETVLAADEQKEILKEGLLAAEWDSPIAGSLHVLAGVAGAAYIGIKRRLRQKVGERNQPN